MGLDNPLHIAIVLVVVLMVFGAKKLPEMGRGLGEGMRGFKSGLTGEHPQPETTTVQQLSAAPAQPAATATSAEERTADPIA